MSITVTDGELANLRARLAQVALELDQVDEVRQAVVGRSLRYRDRQLAAGRVAELRAELEAAQRRITNLEIAVESRDVIGQAKGVLMERFKISPEQAFELLVAASQRTHIKVRDVAQAVGQTGELPGS